MAFVLLFVIVVMSRPSPCSALETHLITRSAESTRLLMLVHLVSYVARLVRAR
jgi:hypothetical protein